MVYGALAVAAAAGTVAAVAAFRAPSRPRLHLETVQVDRGRITGRVTASGTVSALVTVQVGSQVTGRIASLNADFGDQVKKGQVIAQIDPRLFKAAAEQARANLRAASGKLAELKARARDARRRAEREKLLLDQGLVPQAEYDTMLADADAAEAAVEAAYGSVAQAQAAEHQARTNLEYTTIVSPINGVVISRNVDVGQTVAASLQAPTLFTIAEDLSRMQVHTAVAEADVGKLRAGVPAVFTVDAYPEDHFEGVIRQVRDAPQVMQNVVTYDAVIDVNNQKLRLKPGMTANVTFIYADRGNVLRLPSAALRFRPSQDILDLMDAETGTEGPDAGTEATRTVWVLRDGEPSAVAVAVGISDGALVEVTRGHLSEGDVVLTDALELESERSSVTGKKSKRIF